MITDGIIRQSTTLSHVYLFKNSFHNGSLCDDLSNIECLNFYLRQGGYVIGVFCLSVTLSVCLSVCEQDYRTSEELIR